MHRKLYTDLSKALNQVMLCLKMGLQVKMEEKGNRKSSWFVVSWVPYSK